MLVILVCLDTFWSGRWTLDDAHDRWCQLLIECCGLYYVGSSVGIFLIEHSHTIQRSRYWTFWLGEDFFFEMSFRGLSYLILLLTTHSLLPVPVAVVYQYGSSKLLAMVN
jgi:hypothetical protein